MPYWRMFQVWFNHTLKDLEGDISEASYLPDDTLGGHDPLVHRWCPTEASGDHLGASYPV